MKQKLNFGQRMLALRLARTTRQMEKVKEWFNPYVTKIKPELREATKAELKKMKDAEQPKIELPKIQPRIRTDIENAIQHLREQATKLG